MAAKHSRLVMMPPSARSRLLGAWALVLTLLFAGLAPVALAITNTIDGVTTNTVSLTFPSSGSGSSLLILNGGILKNSNTGTIGAGSGNNNNSVIVTNVGSAWVNTGDLFVSVWGTGNSLLIADHAVVSNSVGHIGENAGSNWVRVTGLGSAWVNSGTLDVGYNSGGNNNSLTIDGGATVSDTQGNDGYAGNGNLVTVTGSNSTWNNSGNLLIGRTGVSNTLVIASGGQVNNATGLIGLRGGGNYNSAVVSNLGSVWNNSTQLDVGSASGNYCSLLVADGGKVTTPILWINNGGVNNSLVLSNGSILANTISAGAGPYNFVSFGGQLGVHDSDATWSANLTLTNDGSGNATTITNGAARTVTITGILSGNGLLVKDGAGTLTLNAANTYTGGTTISNGMLKLGVAGAIANQTALRVDGGLVDLNGTALTVSALAGNGGSVSNGSLTANQSSTTTFAGIIAGAVALTKSGAGTLTLSGNNTYTGGTTVSNGTLLVNTTAGSGAVQVKTGATLGGTGTISGAVTIDAGGTLSASAGGLLTLAQAPVLNGTTAIGNGATLNVGTAWSESGVVLLQGGTLAGGDLTNQVSGNLRGWGEVRAALINQGSVTATNGALRLNTFSGAGCYQAVTGGTLTFTTSGSISSLANSNGTVRLEAVLTNNTVFSNAGTLALAGGTYQTSTRLTNSATVTGYGTLGAAATLVNYGTISAIGGIGTPLQINAALTSTGWVTTAASGLEITGMFTNAGTLNMLSSLGTFHSAVVNAGAWITDPSTNLFENTLTVTSTGYVKASTGDVYIFHGDLNNQSTRSNDWQTLTVTPGTGAGSGTKFAFTGSGLTLTQRFTDVGLLLTGGFIGGPNPLSNGVQSVSAYTNVTGFVNNFAVGELELTNTTLLLAQASPSPTPNALFVNDLFLTTDARLILSNNTRLYFVNSNAWAMTQITLLGNAQIHQLSETIQLVPEPNVLAMWLAGLATLYAARRRHQRR